MPMHSPAHPGRLIRADLEALGVSVTKGAEALGVTRSQLHRVIAGECAVSPEMAIRLERVIGSTADHWMRMQAAYDIAEARKAIAASVESLTPLQAA